MLYDFKNSSVIKKNQLKYLFLGVSIGFVGGATSFPAVFGISFPPVGVFLTSIHIIFVTYAIIKHQLMDIRIVITRGFVFTIVYLNVLGIPILIATVWKDYFIKLFGESWVLVLVIITILITSSGLFIYNFLRLKAEKILLNKYNDIVNKKGLLEKYVPHQIREYVGKAEYLKTTRRKITINLEPEELTNILNAYFERMSEIAHKWGGTIDKFIGDSMMVFFGAPESKSYRDDSLKCVRMAREMKKAVKVMGKHWLT